MSNNLYKCKIVRVADSVTPADLANDPQLGSIAFFNEDTDPYVFEATQGDNPHLINNGALQNENASIPPCVRFIFKPLSYSNEGSSANPPEGFSPDQGSWRLCHLDVNITDWLGPYVGTNAAELGTSLAEGTLSDAGSTNFSTQQAGLGGWPWLLGTQFGYGGSSPNSVYASDHWGSTDNPWIEGDYPIAATGDEKFKVYGQLVFNNVNWDNAFNWQVQSITNQANPNFDTPAYGDWDQWAPYYNYDGFTGPGGVEVNDSIVPITDVNTEDFIANNTLTGYSSIGRRIKAVLMTNTIGTEWDNDLQRIVGKEGNMVQVFVVFRQLKGPSYTDATWYFDGDEELVIDFNATATWWDNTLSPGMMPVSTSSQSIEPVHTNITLNIHDVNNDTIEVDWEKNVNGKETIKNSDQKNQINSYSISSDVGRGIKKNIAKIKITAASGTYFSNAPKIKTNVGESLRLTTTSTTKTDNNITSYTLRLSCINNMNKDAIDSMIGNIKYVTKPIETRSTTIDHIDIGQTNKDVASNITRDSNAKKDLDNAFLNKVSSSGETRNITISGKPGAVFGLAINENIEDVELFVPNDASTATGRKIIHKHNDESILGNPNNSTFYDYGKSMPVLSGTIGSSGVFNFKQKFPDNIVLKTKINGAKSAATQITFDDLTGVKVGDRLYSTEISNSLSVTVTNLVSDYVLDVSLPVTLSDNTSVIFKRKKIFSLDVIPELTSELGDFIPKTNPTYRFYQFLDPVVTLRHSISATNYTITHDNGVAISGAAAGAEYDLTYTGAANEFCSKSNLFKINLTLNCGDDYNGAGGAGHTFSAVKIPVMSINNPDLSYWSNVDARKNGGTVVTFRSFTRTATGQSTITISYTFSILKFGSEDVVIELDLDDILTIAT